MPRDIQSLKFSQLINRVKFHSFATSEFVNKVEDPYGWHISELKPINLFTGENNSRKSRLLREIFKTHISIFDSNRLPIKDCTQEVIEGVLLRCNNYGIQIPYREILETHLVHALMQDKPYLESLLSSVPKILHTIATQKVRAHINQDTITQNLLSQFKDLNADINVLVNKRHELNKKVYIPLLRGLRPLEQSNTNTNLYRDRTVKDYFANCNEMGEIFTGLELYNELKIHLLGNHQQREIIKRYEQYLSQTFFENQDLALVPRLNEDVVYLKIGEFERPIFDLGDGIQSLIILTFKVFTATEPSMFLIEEPEQHLHAGMQRILIDALSRFDQHLYFMTTHSNHLIDIAQEQDNIAVHRVANKPDGTASEITPLTDFSDALADLGVRASSVLLANCSIWVEGVTDKLYLRVYLEKYLSNLENSDVDTKRERAAKLRQFKENLHYVFTEYQGSNITHWNFGDTNGSSDSSTPAKKLNNKIFLLADGDIAGKAERVKELRGKLGKKFFLLKSKEIENQIPFDVLVKTAETRWNSFNETAGLTFNSENLKAKPQDFFDVEDSGIGIMLERYIHVENSSSKTGKAKDFFKAKSGTIKDKVKFCHVAVEIMQNEEFEWELTPKLNDLCEAIWTHIEDSN